MIFLIFRIVESKVILLKKREDLLVFTFCLDQEQYNSRLDLLETASIEVALAKQKADE
jgi:hypothetical protein